MILFLVKFTDIVQFCETMANAGKIVVVAALDGTYQRSGTPSFNIYYLINFGMFSRSLKLLLVSGNYQNTGSL